MPKILACIRNAQESPAFLRKEWMGFGGSPNKAQVCVHCQNMSELRLT